ncbi:CapA family protein [Evansella tamaricis]|uniref:CapA family protein n=1 Tax=Evansella tamaricis TaxID=2069301 RepID=A0ABS6JN93_9BACI|nr:CapA family protein [Evansella tamaricis]MBU9714840.1 CapA family protein [Evansella tamaricis]
MVKVRKTKKIFLVYCIAIIIFITGAFAFYQLTQQNHSIPVDSVEKAASIVKERVPFQPTRGEAAAWGRIEEPVRITFVGDVLLDLTIKETIRTKGHDYPFVYVKDDLQSVDLAVANLETPLTKRDSSYKDTNQRFNFQSNPEDFQGIINAGFDLVSLGNNHALDYGEKGLLDTMEALEDYGFDYIGAGRTIDEAFQSQTYKINGKTISIMGATRFVPSGSWYTFGQNTLAGVAGAYDLDYLVEMVKREKEGTDYLVLYIHWGIERTDRPAEYQKYYVRKLVEAGVDAIVGHHPHVLQGFEYYDGVPVAYSLGNFLFPDYVTGPTAETGLLTLTFDDGKIGMEFKPYYIYKDQIIPLSDDEQKRILNKLENLSYDVKIDGYQIIDLR